MKIARTILSMVFVFSILVSAGCKSQCIEIVNTGSHVIEIEIPGKTHKLLLGENSKGCFNLNDTFQVGDALVKVNRRIKVINTGSDMIKINYADRTGTQRTIMIGESGIAHFNKSTPFHINNAKIIIAETTS